MIEQENSGKELEGTNLPKIAVVILNWNGQKHLETYLPSVCTYSKGAEIWVADNHSNDHSVAFVKEFYPQIKIWENDSNEGFAGGYNSALKNIKADIYVLLNSDVEVTPNWLTDPVAILNVDAKTAAVQPKMLSFVEKDKFEHAGAAGGYLDKNGFPFCRGRIFNTAEDDLDQYSQSTDIFWASGACLFIKADVFHELNGFDADFFAHMEEIDLCWRLKNRGYRIKYAPKSHVYHLGGGTLDIYSPFKLYLNFRNNLFLLVKNYQGFIWSKVFWRMTLDAFAAGLFLSKFQFKYINSVWKAHRDFYKGLRATIKKRKVLKTTWVNDTRKELYPRNIAFDYFVLRKKKFKDLKKW